MKYIVILAIPFLLLGCSGISESSTFAEETIEELSKNWSFETLRPRLSKEILADEKKMARLNMRVVLIGALSGEVESVKKENNISTSYNFDVGNKAALESKHKFDIKCKNGLVTANLETSKIKDKITISEIEIEAPSMNDGLDKLKSEARKEAKAIAEKCLTNWNADFLTGSISTPLSTEFPDLISKLNKQLQDIQSSYGEFENFENISEVDSNVELGQPYLEFSVELLARCSKSSAKVEVTLLREDGKMKFDGITVARAKAE